MTSRDPLSLAAAQSLCESISSLAADEPGALAALDDAIDQGWTPYLQDLHAEKKAHVRASAQLFSSKGQHLPCFARVVGKFPSFALHFPLLTIPRDMARQESVSQTDLDRLMDSTRSPWPSLPGAHRAFLIQALPADHFAPPPEDALAPLWIRAMGRALLPSFPLATTFRTDPFASGATPFFGYFDSSAWHLVKAARPRLAHGLATFLMLACQLAQTEKMAAAPWSQVAATASLSLASPLDLISGSDIRRFAYACSQRFLALDRPDLLMPLINCLNVDVQANEALFFDSQVGLAEFLRPALAAQILSSSHRLTPFNAAATSSKESIPRLSALGSRDFGLRQVSMPVGVERVPFLAAAALHNASACWSSLIGAASGHPTIERFVQHKVRLSSPLVILRRLTEHLARAKPEAAGQLRQNLEAEAARARHLIDALPLTASLRSALLGEAAPPSCGDSQIKTRGEGSGLALECEKAKTKFLAGQGAHLRLWLAFDWTAHLLAGGVAPSFLSGKIEIGALARARKMFDLVEFPTPLSRLPAAEIAFLERDEMLLDSIPPSSISDRMARPRL